MEYHGYKIPEELQEAWARYQRGEPTDGDLRVIDEFKADVHEEIASSAIRPKDDFAIAFAGEAYETFQNLIRELEGYGVTVTTESGEIIEAVLIGPDVDAEDGGTIIVQPVSEGEIYDVYSEHRLPPRSVTVGRVEVA